MSYRVILTLASIGLAVRYAVDFEASVVGRLVLVLLVLGSLLLPTATIVGQVLGILVQLGASLFVLFRLKLNANSQDES